MPSWSTRATLDEIRRRHAGVGTLVISGYSADPELGHYFQLPLEIEVFDRAVAELVAEFRPV